MAGLATGRGRPAACAMGAAQAAAAHDRTPVPEMERLRHPQRHNDVLRTLPKQDGLIARGQMDSMPDLRVAQRELDRALARVSRVARDHICDGNRPGRRRPRPLRPTGAAGPDVAGRQS